MHYFQKNNLDKALSPYLALHKDSPIFWQEWSAQIPDYARQANKLIFISIGYTTCSWCSIMAQESFKDPKAISFLNEHFIAVKVDREQRPDIDQYATLFAVQTQGAVGWPLNIIFTPTLKPFIAFSYLPKEPIEQVPSFIKILNDAQAFWQENNQKIPMYNPPVINVPDFPAQSLVPALSKFFDGAHGGFGVAPKFSPHATLIFLLHYFERVKQQDIFIMIKNTLDSMLLLALHDHLQGGFFKYCSDAAWLEPRFEKTLYDQAFFIWTLSHAAKVLKEDDYKTVVLKCIECLETTFEENYLMATALAPFVDKKNVHPFSWTLADIKKVLSPEEYESLLHLYEVPNDENTPFALTKKRLTYLPIIEEKLLNARNQKTKLVIDKKNITSWNALVATSLCIAGRSFNEQRLTEKAATMLEKLLKINVDDGAVSHSSMNAHAQHEGFLEDYAALLLLASYLHEDNPLYEDLLRSLRTAVLGFKKGDVWYENVYSDFLEVPASNIDHTIISTVSLSEYALWRTAVLLHEEYKPMAAYKEPLNLDFYNLTVFASTGNFYIIESPQALPWNSLPINCIQRRGPKLRATLGKETQEFKSADELLNWINR